MADKLVYELQDILEDRNTNLKPENLRKGVTCLGVEGAMEVSSSIYNQDKIIKPTTQRQIVNADEKYTGLGTITIEAIDNTIDENITS